MRLLSPVLLALAALAALGTLCPQPAGAATTVRTPIDDAGFPFWCDWSYDWEAHCYRDFGPRLPVGGADDKVWRAGLRFSLAGIPPGAAVQSARLELVFDRVCVAPRLKAIPCPGSAFVLEAYPIASADWYHEREPDYFWNVEDEVYLDTSAGAQTVGWDLTGLVRSWLAGAVENNGVLLKLADGLEDFDAGGPYFPSGDAPDPATRPKLVITYESPTGLAR
jgi:hypothetical protein